MQELQILLNRLITSKNYVIEHDCGYRLYYTGKKIPSGCKQYGREQLVYLSKYNDMKHLLILISALRHRARHLSLKEFINRMGYLFDQCISHLAYGYSFEGSKYISEIDLPYEIKKLTYSYLEKKIKNCGYSGDDSEGNSYNYLELVTA